jgi:hypothetical protein
MVASTAANASMAHVTGAFIFTSHIKADSDTAAPVKKQSLSLGLSYGSDASFFGRTSPNRFPYFTSDVIYNTKSGWFVYGSAWKVIGSPPAVDEFDIGGGYAYHLSKKFKGSVSYTKFLFDPEAAIIKSASSNDINLNNSFDWKILKTAVTLDYLYGKSNDFFTTIGNSHYFESNFSVFDKKDYLTFTPSFNIILGTQNFVERFSADHGYYHIKDGGGSPPPPGQPFVPNDDDLRIAQNNSQFKVLNYNIKIPIGYNRPHYTLEASYKYSIPKNVEGSLMNKHESFFNLTFYYIFY